MKYLPCGRNRGKRMVSVSLTSDTDVTASCDMTSSGERTEIGEKSSYALERIME